MIEKISELINPEIKWMVNFPIKDTPWKIFYNFMTQITKYPNLDQNSKNSKESAWTKKLENPRLPLKSIT